MVPIRSHLAPRWLTRFFYAGGCLVFFAAAAVSRGADTNQLFNQWLSVQTNLHSWTGDFTQTRFLKVMTEPLPSAGKVWVRTGEFRWELGNPVQTIVVRRPGVMLIAYPQLKRVEKYSLEGDLPETMKGAMSLLDATLPRDRATMEKQFRLLTASETNSVLQMTLQPNSASARKFIGQIVIGFRTNDYSIAVTEMRFADGTRLRNDFTNVVMNQSIDDERFTYTVPPDFTVVEPLRQ